MIFFEYRLAEMILKFMCNLDIIYVRNKNWTKLINLIYYYLIILMNTEIRPSRARHQRRVEESGLHKQYVDPHEGYQVYGRIKTIR